MNINAFITITMLINDMERMRYLPIGMQLAENSKKNYETRTDHSRQSVGVAYTCTRPYYKELKLFQTMTMIEYFSPI